MTAGARSSQRFPWLLFAVGAVAVGSVWDVSWDASIGRHSFWSPPHVLVNFGALLAACGALGRIRERTWGGIAVAALAGGGSLAMALAELLVLGQPPQPDALADDSLARTLGIVGIGAIAAAAWGEAVCASAARSFREAIAGGMALVVAATMLGVYSLPNLQRTALFLHLAAGVYPALLVMASAGRRRWAATSAAGVYTATIAVLVWILPLFPATPAAEVVYTPTTHMLPPRFPLLLLLPAAAIDMAYRPLMRLRWLAVPGLALVFLVAFFPAQWTFAAFLLSPASDTWFFAGGGRHWPFFVEVGAERALFWGAEQSPVDAWAVVWTGVVAMLSVAVGRGVGRRIEVATHR